MSPGKCYGDSIGCGKTSLELSVKNNVNKEFSGRKRFD